MMVCSSSWWCAISMEWHSSARAESKCSQHAVNCTQSYHWSQHVKSNYNCWFVFVFDRNAFVQYIISFTENNFSIFIFWKWSLLCLSIFILVTVKTDLHLHRLTDGLSGFRRLIWHLSSNCAVLSSLRARCTNVVHELGSAEPRSKVEPRSRWITLHQVEVGSADPIQLNGVVIPWTTLIGQPRSAYGSTTMTSQSHAMLTKQSSTDWP